MASNSKSKASASSSSSGNSEGGQARKRNYPIFEQHNQNEPKRGKNDDGDDENGDGEDQTKGPLKIWSWNVAGLRGCVKKGAHKQIQESGADIIILQETKCPEMPNEINALDTYRFKRLVASKENGGYAGIAMLSKEKPIKVEIGIGDEEYDKHGRFIQAEFKKFFFIGVYVPNSGRGLVNLANRGRWDQKMLDKVKALDQRKPVIISGDLNVAHQEIDLRNPDTNRNKTAGFTDQEREAFTQLLNVGFVDVWRRRNPKQTGAYTYWSYIGNRKASNIGWRLDYFVVSERIFDQVQQCEIHANINGSDHCPISMDINI